MGAKDRNRQYVLDKAKQLFTERGVTGVSMTDVASFADFGVASVYRYFGGKNALVMECAVALWEDKLDRMRVLYDEILPIRWFPIKISRIFCLRSTLF